MNLSHNTSYACQGIFNVATTSTKSAPTVLKDIVHACESKGYDTKEKGYVVLARF